MRLRKKEKGWKEALSEAIQRVAAYIFAWRGCPISSLNASALK
jgi:hypothetical protein